MATRTQIPITKVLIGEEELRAVQLPLETGWVVQGPHVAGVRGQVRRYTQAKHARCDQLLHHGAAHLRRRARAKARRRGHRPGIHVGVDRERRRVHGREADLLRRRPRHLQHRPARRSSRSSPSARSGSSRCTCSGSRADMDPIMELAAQARALGRRGRRLLASAAGTAASTPARSATPAASASTRASRSRRARAG